MIAAIYARKSTDQGAVSDEQRSVTRQVEHARSFATAKGWAVDDAHIYVDDGISGAEFAARPGFVRLMNALKPKAPFDVLIMSEESRLGREAIETSYALKQLLQAGVRVWFYLEGRERTLDSPTDKLLMSVTAFADELEREKARQRTYDAMLRKAKAGHVTGGRVFGYDNVEVLNADGSRSHVERRINEAEAAVVRRIFSLAAQGVGVRRLCRQLNGEGAPAPRAQRGRPVAWAPSSVFAVLHRELYRGVIVWNQTKKRNTWGQSKRSERDQAEWLRIEAPELRIVSEELWQRAHRHRAARRDAYLQATGGRLYGRRANDRDSNYLLPGFARCAVCGGGLRVVSRAHGKRRAYFYVCSSSYDRGKAVCPVSQLTPMEALDAAVLDALREDILRPVVLTRAVDLALDELCAGPSEDRRKRLEQQRDALVAECQRLGEAIAAGGPIPTLVQLLERKDAERAAIEADLAALARQTPPTVDRALVRRKLEAELADWRRLLAQEVAGGREVLRTLLHGPLVCKPLERGRKVPALQFEGQVALGRVLDGIAEIRSYVLASPTGSADLYRPVGGTFRRAA